MKKTKRGQPRTVQTRRKGRRAGSQPGKSRLGLASGGDCSFPTARPAGQPECLKASLRRTPQARARPTTRVRSLPAQGRREAAASAAPPARTPVLGAAEPLRRRGQPRRAGDAGARSGPPDVPAAASHSGPGGAQDHCFSAANAPRVSIRGCLLPTLARMRHGTGRPAAANTNPASGAYPARGPRLGRKTHGSLATFAARGRGGAVGRPSCSAPGGGSAGLWGRGQRTGAGPRAAALARVPRTAGLRERPRGEHSL